MLRLTHLFSPKEGSSQIRSPKVCLMINSQNYGFTEICFAKIRFGEIDIDQPSLDKDGLVEYCSTQVSPCEPCSAEVGFTQISPAEIRSEKLCPIQVGFNKHSLAQVRVSQIGSDEIRSIQEHLTQIPPS